VKSNNLRVGNSETINENEPLAPYFIQKPEVCFEKPEEFIEQTDTVY
jgi:hypothetical protein